MDVLYSFNIYIVTTDKQKWFNSSPFERKEQWLINLNDENLAYLLRKERNDLGQNGIEAFCNLGLQKNNNTQNISQRSQTFHGKKIIYMMNKCDIKQSYCQTEFRLNLIVVASQSSAQTLLNLSKHHIHFVPHWHPNDIEGTHQDPTNCKREVSCPMERCSHTLNSLW